MEKKVIVKVEDVSIKFSLASEKFDGFKEYFIQRVKKKRLRMKRRKFARAQ
jgi:ABC-2 type transport system ATP-binding protein